MRYSLYNVARAIYLRACASESKVVSSYPDTDNFPKFYNLANVLKGMVELKLNIHPQTREMLSSLDRQVVGNLLPLQNPML